MLFATILTAAALANAEPESASLLQAAVDSVGAIQTDTTCSEACSEAFMDCLRRSESRGKPQPYAFCRARLDKGFGAVGRTCESGCADTDDMASAKGPSTSTEAPASETTTVADGDGGDGDDGDDGSTGGDWGDLPNVTNVPKCAAGEVVSLTDGVYERCISLVTPSSGTRPLPVVFWFHGSGGSARTCPLAKLAEKQGFAVVCGEATQNVFGKGGKWHLPAKMTDETGTPCGADDSVEVTYFKNVLAHLEKSPELYDTKRLYTAGCSMGSAFSGYISNCLKQWDPTQVSSFAMHSSGLKLRGDGNTIRYNYWCEECEDAQWFPFVPTTYSDSLGLKACIYDNTGDRSALFAGKQLEEKWRELGNPLEAHYPEGGHCQNIDYEDILRCLGV